MDVNNNNIGDNTELQARGNWNQMKGAAKQKWSNLTDDDLTYTEGKQDEWLGRLQEKTGETIDSIKNWFHNTTSDAGAVASGNSTELKARGDWNQIKGQAKQKWGNLTDDDLDYEDGKQDEWYGRLQEKTGHAVDDIKSWFQRTF
ncbi:CsbD family protein [Hymenobacter sp. UYCo722]|uniref:CsbD family protein n=1 Tax=Hymenobacter sp. UYCo722 TaxID=3156335 RepID=UPI003392B39D